MQQPEAYIGEVNHLFDTDSDVSKEENRKFLQKYMEAYASWVDR